MKHTLIGALLLTTSTLPALAQDDTITIDFVYP